MKLNPFSYFTERDKEYWRKKITGHEAFYPLMTREDAEGRFDWKDYMQRRVDKYFALQGEVRNFIDPFGSRFHKCILRAKQLLAEEYGTKHKKRKNFWKASNEENDRNSRRENEIQKSLWKAHTDAGDESASLMISSWDNAYYTQSSTAPPRAVSMTLATPTPSKWWGEGWGAKFDYPLMAEPGVEKKYNWHDYMQRRDARWVELFKNIELLGRLNRYEVESVGALDKKKLLAAIDRVAPKKGWNKDKVWSAKEDVLAGLHEAYLSTLSAMATSVMTEWDSYYSIHKTPPPATPRAAATTTPRTNMHPLRPGAYTTHSSMTIWPDWATLATAEPTITPPPKMGWGKPGTVTKTLTTGKVDGDAMPPSVLSASKDHQPIPPYTGPFWGFGMNEIIFIFTIGLVLLFQVKRLASYIASLTEAHKKTYEVGDLVYMNVPYKRKLLDLNGRYMRARDSGPYLIVDKVLNANTGFENYDLDFGGQFDFGLLAGDALRDDDPLRRGGVSESQQLRSTRDQPTWEEATTVAEKLAFVLDFTWWSGKVMVVATVFVFSVIALVGFFDSWVRSDGREL